MRNRPQRLPSNNGMSDDEESDSDETPHGIQQFNFAAASFPSTPYMFNCPNWHHELNYVCPHCISMLWKDERKHRVNCCNNGKYTIPALISVLPELMNTLQVNSFKGHRDDITAYFEVCSFTALGAGGVDKWSWTQPNKAQYVNSSRQSLSYDLWFATAVRRHEFSNSGRIYIFDS